MKTVANAVEQKVQHDLKEQIAETLLRYFLPVLVGGLAIVVVVNILVGIPLSKNLAAIIALTFSIISLLFYYRKQYLCAVYAMIAVFSLAFLVQAYVYQSFRSVGGVFFTILILIWCSLFTTRKFTLLYLLFVCSLSITVGLLLLNGTMKEQLLTNPTPGMIASCIGYVMVVLTMSPTVHFLVTAINASRENEQKLSAAYAEVEHSRNFTIQAVNNSRELFGWIAPDGTVQFLNKTGLQIMNVPSAAILGLPLWETPLFCEDLSVRNAIEEKIQSRLHEGLYHSRLTFTNTRDQKREIDFYMRSVHSDDGKITHFVIEGIDITEEQNALRQQQYLTEQLHQSQKMEAVGQLAGGIAHDFNNALGGIVGAVELIKGAPNLDEEQREYIDLIMTAADRAGDLTKKLLTFSRLGTKVSSAVDVAQVVKDTTGLLSHTINKSITIALDNRAVQTSVIGDNSMLQNALMNMGINASHAMPNGGKLTFALENLELDAEYCEVSPFEIKPGEYLEISIRDTGCGMPPEIMSRIFEPFFTTKEAGKGTGLGMSAVYGAVQEHGGAITVYSEVGVGTVFHIYLPVTEERVNREVTEEVVGAGTGTILVIDDEELIRVTASAMLCSMGYKVILATDGQEGVNTFREAHHEIDLIILDMIMPVMGGREAFVNLREIDPNIPIVIASGFAKEEDMAELKKQGANGFLDKPFRKAELAEMVGKAVGRS